MYFTKSPKTRLYFAAAVVEGLLGWGLIPAEAHAGLHGIAPYLTYLWAALLAGSIVILMLGRYHLHSALQWAGVMVAAAPLAWGGSLLGRAGISGAPIAGAGLALVVLSLPWLARRPTSSRLPLPPKGTLENVEVSIEVWSWLLTLVVLAFSVLPTGDGVPGTTRTIRAFVAVMSGYSSLAYWALPHIGTPQQRVTWHLTILTWLLSSMVSEAAPGGHAFLALAAVPPILAARALGPSAGWRLTLLAVPSAVAGDIRDMVLGITHRTMPALLSHIVIQSFLLYAGSALGIQRSKEKWDLLTELQAQQEELRAQNEELLTQRDQLAQALAAREAAEEAQSRLSAEQRRSELALQESEQRFRTAFGEAPIGIALTDPDGRWVQVNRSLANMFGYTEDELVKTSVAQRSHPDDLDLTLRWINQLVTGTETISQFEKRFIHHDGHVVWAKVRGSTVSDASGKLAFMILHITDITERKMTEAQLIQLANYDPLTGLFNRRRFHEELERTLALSKRQGAGGALFFLDLDQFKYVNDTLGHIAGDDLLKSVANALRQRLRDTDTIGRLSGDEFAILLPNTDGTQATVVADALMECLRHHISVVGGQPVTVSASIGIAVFPEHGDNSRDLLARADLAMYRAKEQGRNGWSFYHPDQSELAEMESKITWEHRIRQALELDQFVPYFQPIMDMQTGRMERYEMLLRLHDGNNRVVRPGAFLNVAERFGLIHEVDRWVVQRAIRLIAERAQHGQPLCLEVNLSGKAFNDTELLPLIRRELTETGINPAYLILEITETAAVADTNLARHFIEDLAGLGCRFAIDDFGAGFSSFSYLKHLPVDFLKIDGSFVRNLIRDPVDQHLVRTIVDLARGLGKQTIAEFVGDAETLMLLQSYGVDFAQGYYVGEPVPLEVLLERQP
ncbi:MAG TPA: EAL domain-containing protein [Symbiobacteriaceae bacterium]|nr:EAL domain-containing protein [Symbiobacteriaceae bacterium]